MTANADRNVCIYNAKPFEDETDGKEHCESQNEQQVLGSKTINLTQKPFDLIIGKGRTDVVKRRTITITQSQKSLTKKKGFVVFSSHLAELGKPVRADR